MNRKLLSSVGEFVCGLVAYFFLSIPLHEVFHLITLQAFGGEGYIELTWLSGKCVITKLPVQGLFIIYLMGGVGCGATWLLLAFWSYLNGKWENYAALVINGLPQVLYGVTEALCVFQLAPTQYVFWSSVLWLVGLAVACLITLPKLVSYWKNILL